MNLWHLQFAGNRLGLLTRRLCSNLRPVKPGQGRSNQNMNSSSCAGHHASSATPTDEHPQRHPARYWKPLHPLKFFDGNSPLRFLKCMVTTGLATNAIVIYLFLRYELAKTTP